MKVGDYVIEKDYPELIWEIYRTNDELDVYHLQLRGEIEDGAWARSPHLTTYSCRAWTLEPAPELLVLAVLSKEKMLHIPNA